MLTSNRLVALAGSVAALAIATACGDSGGSVDADTSVDADETGPQPLSTTPEDGAAEVPRDASVSVTFAEPIDPSTLTTESFTLADDGGALVPGAVVATDSGGTFTPARRLSLDRTYTATVTTGVTDALGNALADDFTWSFAPHHRTWGAAEMIESLPSASVYNPEIAFDAEGNAMTVWTTGDIWANRYTAEEGWSLETRISVNNGSSAAAAQLAVDDAGNAIAVWSQSNGTRPSIWANRYIVGTGPGTGWRTPTLIETDDAGNASAPQIAMHGSGNAFVVWVQYDGTRFNVWASQYAVDGGWGTPGVIETGANDPYNPKIAMDDTGNAVVVWNEYDGTSYDIVSNRYSVGSGWGNEGPIDAQDAMPSGAEVAVDGAGNAIAVWHQGSGYWSRRYEIGIGWGTAEQIWQYDGDGYVSSIEMDGDGNALAVWSNDGWIRATRYVVGSGWGSVNLLETGGAGGASPQIAVDADGNGLVASMYWATRYTVGSDLGTIGQVIEGPIAIGTGVGDAEVAVDGDGNAIVVWPQTAGKPPYNLWARTYR